MTTIMDICRAWLDWGWLWMIIGLFGHLTILVIERAAE